VTTLQRPAATPVDRCPTPGKVRHPTPQAAAVAMTRLQRATGARDLNTYRCPAADGSNGHWHVGHSRVLLSRRIRRALSRRVS